MDDEQSTVGTSRAEVWTVPTIDDKNFKAKFGFSVVEEFVSGHDANDVLRELVQNEYDAGGKEIWITFGSHGLTVKGAGRPIDAKGWRRLEVFLGTGRVVGGQTGDTIEGKINGIGSKNFGLRSLFLFGNRIFVRSAGKMAVLDLSAGTQNISDPSTHNKRGVEIYVEYRQRAFQNLRPFSVEREHELFDHMANGFLATFIKLAQSEKNKGLNTISIRSERTGRQLKWRQTAVREHSKAGGTIIIRRKGQLTENDPRQVGTGIAKSFEEIEFTKIIDIRKDLAETYPGYYKAVSNKIRIAVSLPIKRKKIDRSRPGNFYYPLLAGSSPTGNLVSVSAPFKLNSDRSALIESEWNRWLCEMTGQFVGQLLVADWVTRFGSEAYLSLRKSWPAKPDQFANSVLTILNSDPVWRTRESKGIGCWKKATEMVLPVVPEFYNYLEDNRYLAAELSSDSELATFFQDRGSKPFSINSLVRLRCAPKEAQHLETKVPQTDANYFYSDFDSQLSRSSVQLRMAASLKAISKRLSKQNWQDLKESVSTLAANGALLPASKLTLVEEDIWVGCPVPMSSRLHRELIDAPIISKLCKPFKVNDWILEACGRAESNEIDADERVALYRHILTHSDTLTPAAVAAIRRSPVVKDEFGNWVAARDLVMLPKALATQIAIGIRAPAKEVQKRVKVLKKLRIRRQVAAEDFVNYAEAAIWTSSSALAFEDLLRKYVTHLTPMALVQLGRLPFLHSRVGNLQAPIELHIDSTENIACLGENGPIVSGSNAPLYRKLGCRSTPTLRTLLDVLERCRSVGAPPQGSIALYQNLIAAIHSEKAASVSQLPILWIGNRYEKPDEILIGGVRVPKWANLFLPVFRGSAAVEAAYITLGAHTQLQNHHWVAVFEAIEERTPKGVSATRADLSVLHDIYKRRQQFGLPLNLPSGTRSLASRDGRLYSLDDLNTGFFLEDDFPDLAEALGKVDHRYGFVDVTDDVRVFFKSIGLRTLTDYAPLPKTTVGRSHIAPSWYRKDRHDREILDLCERPLFVFALHSLATAYQRRVPAFQATSFADTKRRLSKIRRIDFVTELVHTYRLTGLIVRVSGEATVEDDRIALIQPRSKGEFDQRIVLAFADLLGAKKITDIRQLSNATTPLLLYRSDEEMRAHLRRQGINPPAFHTEMPPAQEASEIGNAREDILRQLVDGLSAFSEAPTLHIMPQKAVEPAVSLPSPPKPAIEPVPALPPLDKVALTVVDASACQLQPRVPSIVGGGSYGRYWAPPTPSDAARDLVVGERGEEIVYLRELERVRATGLANPEEYVIWVPIPG